MAAFGYIAIDKDGKEVKGSLEADTRDAVLTKLRVQGMMPVSVSEQSALTKDINIDIGGKVSPRDLSVFCRQFVSMTRAGVTILEALKLLSEQSENKKLFKAVNAVRVSVEKGETLADALAAFPKVFPSLMVTTVAAGEASGSLDIALERMAEHFEKNSRTQSLVKKAMIYPCVIAVVAVVVVIVMLVVVIPNYVDMFAQMNVEMPAITQLVINMSNFVQQHWLMLIIVVAACIAAIKWFSGTEMGQLTLGRLSLKIPIFKNLIVKSNSAMLARTLSTLVSAGVPLIDAVEITSRTMTNVLFKIALLDAKEAIIRGMPLSAPLQDCGLFPPMVYHMIRIGEESGAIEEMLEKLADYYDEEVELATQALMAAMEPMIIIVMAAIVGLLVASVMAPMLKMYDSIDKL